METQQKGTAPERAEFPVPSVNGWMMLIILLIVVIFFGWHTVTAVSTAFSEHENAVSWFSIVGYGIGTCAALIALSGLVSLEPKEARVYTFAGNYKGTLRGPDFAYVPFWYGSDGVRNVGMETIVIGPMAINDLDGNPILFGCTVKTHEDDTYKAKFDVVNLGDFLETQGEVASRKVVMKHPYDAEDENDTNQKSDAAQKPNNIDGLLPLKGNSDKICEELKQAIAEEYAQAGYVVDSVGISELKYADAIAALMLQKQQAKATIQARKTITEGALGIIEDTLKKLEEKSIVKFDASNKQRLVTNLLVVLCSSKEATPVVELKSEEK